MHSHWFKSRTNFRNLDRYSEGITTRQSATRNWFMSRCRGVVYLFCVFLFDSGRSTTPYVYIFFFFYNRLPTFLSTPELCQYLRLVKREGKSRRVRDPRPVIIGIYVNKTKGIKKHDFFLLLFLDQKFKNSHRLHVCKFCIHKIARPLTRLIDL